MEITEIDNLDAEKIKLLTSDEAAEIANLIETESDKEKRSAHQQLLSANFEFRSVSIKSKGRQHDLERMGFKFFSIPNDKFFVRGIRKFINY